MKNFSVLFSISLLFLAGSFLVPRPLWSQSFFSTVIDLPIMPGLAEVNNETFFFDKPSGRIVEAVASGRPASPIGR